MDVKHNNALNGVQAMTCPVLAARLLFAVRTFQNDIFLVGRCPSAPSSPAGDLRRELLEAVVHRAAQGGRAGPVNVGRPLAVSLAPSDTEDSAWETDPRSPLTKVNGGKDVPGPPITVSLRCCPAFNTHSPLYTALNGGRGLGVLDYSIPHSQTPPKNVKNFPALFALGALHWKFPSLTSKVLVGHATCCHTLSSILGVPDYLLQISTKT